jgi:hypothetical protein
MSKIEKRKTYQFFKRELDELLNAGFSVEQASIILKRMDNAINKWRGYHYEHIASSAGESLEYLLKQLSEAKDDATNPLMASNRMRVPGFPASAEVSL